MIGETFLSEEVQTRKGLKRHLFIIVAEKDDSFLAVPVTSYEDNRYCSSECLLNSNDHPFIDRKSWVDFSKARSYTYLELKIKYDNYTFVPQTNFNEPQLSLVIAKTQISEDLPEKFLSFFE